MATEVGSGAAKRISLPAFCAAVVPQNQFFFALFAFFAVQ